jgi:hypothetical protein
MAPTNFPGYSFQRDSGHWYKEADGTGPYGFDSSSGTPTPYLIGSGGGGGGGAGSATSANQATQITAEQAMQASLASIDGKTVSHAAAIVNDASLALTLNSALTWTISADEAAIGLDISGLTGSGATIVFETSENVGAATPSWGGMTVLSGKTLVSSTTTDGRYRLEVGARSAVRVRVSVAGTGTAKVTSTTTSATALVSLAQVATIQFDPPALVDVSGKITTGGTFQTIVAAATATAPRRGFSLQNLSTGDLWLNDQGNAAINSATPQSFQIPPGVLFEYPAHGVPQGALSIIGATTGQAFAARVW